MEQDFRGRDGNSHKDPNNKNRYQNRSNSAPTNFEGMNYEQDRSEYRNTSGSRRDDTGGGNNSGKRRDDL